jgi:hypothetical protein
MRIKVITVLAAVLFVRSGEAFAQNALTNGDFTSDLSGWTLIDVATGTTSFDGLSGSAAVGCARAILASPGAGNTIQGLAQCIDITGITPPYDFGGRTFTNSSSGSSGLNIIVEFWTGASCTGSQVSDSPATGGLVPGTPGDFFQWADTGVANPNSAVSVRFVAQVETNGATDTIDVSFDSLYFGPAGTTPVSLQAFTVE